MREKTSVSITPTLYFSELSIFHPTQVDNIKEKSERAKAINVWVPSGTFKSPDKELINELFNAVYRKREQTK